MIAIQKILVPTDFSAPADAALQYAAELAETVGASLQLFHVVALPTFYAMGPELPTAPMFELMGEVEATARKTLAEQAERLSLPANRVTVRTTVGMPVSEILDTIENDQVDLVVMGTHGRGMVEHLLLGSVAERVVRRSPVPVLTVHGSRTTGRMKPATPAAEAAR